MKIILFGSTGMLGNYVYSYLNKEYNVNCIIREDYNILENNHIKLGTLLDRFEPGDIVINCTGVIPQQKNNDENEYIIINSVFPKLLSGICKEKKYKLIHITTNCIFSGKTGNYTENDCSDCNDTYGITKHEGEDIDACIIRSSIIGREQFNKHSLLEWVLSNANKTINGYTNVFWNGVTCLEMSKIIYEIIKNNKFWKGVRHIYSKDIVSKYQLVQYINDIFDLNINVIPIEYHDGKNLTLKSVYDELFNIKSLKEQILELKEYKLEHNTIQMFSNSLGNRELEAIKKVFDSKWLFMGHECKRFEERFAEKIGSDCVLMTNGCANSIYMVLYALGIGEGDEVIMPTNTFISCPSSVKLLGATPIFCDIEWDTCNIDVDSCKSKITERTKAIIVLHYSGYPCKFDELKEAVGTIPIIEDSANSTLSYYKGKACGTLGTFGCFSFDACKMICVGEGGAISVNDKNYIEDLHNIRLFGFPSNAKTGVEKSQTTYKWWEIQIKRPALKFIPSDITAAIANTQLDKLNSFIDKRKYIRNLYDKLLSTLPQVQLPPKPSQDFQTCNYLYWIRVDQKYRDKLLHYLKDNNIYCTIKYWPVNMVDIFKDGNTYTNSSQNIKEIFNLPLHHNLTSYDVYYIYKHIKQFFSQNA